MGNVAGRFVVRDFHIYFHWHGQDFFSSHIVRFWLDPATTLIWCF